jgi:molybdopterin-binding protein
VVHIPTWITQQIPVEGKGMKISARNKLHGTIVDVTKGATTAHVRIDLGGGAVVTASITNEAVDELKLKKGEKAYAVIKATDVMVGLD